MQSKPKQSKCKVCDTTYLKSSMRHTVCSPACSTKLLGLKASKPEKARALKKTKTLADWKKTAQTVFNTYIRIRDESLGCISCGTKLASFHAGHYCSVGSHPELRYDEDNVHKQCATCNTFRHGNLIRYRQNLILKIGVERVERLEGKNPAKKYTIAELEELISLYRLRTASLVNEK